MQERGTRRGRSIGQEDRLVCIHIPKSGGTTLVATIEPLWKPEARYPVYNGHELQGVVPQTLDRYQSFVGHYYFSEIEWLIGTPFRSLTMLREPSARFLSNFLHMKYRPREEVPFQDRTELDAIRRMSLEEFVFEDAMLIPGESVNLQTRLLGAPLYPSSVARSRTEPYYGVVDLRMPRAEAAKATLEKMDAFGLTERMQDSLFYFAYTFGWKPLYEKGVLNRKEAAAEKEVVTERARERMRALNVLDVQLYEYAVDLFEMRYREMMEDLLTTHGARSQARLKYPLTPAMMGELLERHHLNKNKKPSRWWQMFRSNTPKEREETGGTAGPIAQTAKPSVPDLPRVRRIRPDDRLVSIHIPKTAGTTLNAMIDPLWMPRERFPLYNRHELQGVIPESLDKYRSFSGHYNLSEIEFLLASPFVSITMLREPTARYLSNFLHLKYKPPFQARPIVERELPLVRQLSVEEFVTRKDLFIPGDMANLQTRILGAPLDPTTLPTTRQEPYYGRLDRAKMSVEVAKEKLVEMHCFGLTERFQDSLDIFAYTFGWEPMEATHVLNPKEAAAEREVVTERARERIYDLNAMDVEVYDYAVGLFEERMQEMTENLLGRYGTGASSTYPLEHEEMRELLRKHHYAMTQTV